jgi:hypothetical protein
VLKAHDASERRTSAIELVPLFSILDQWNGDIVDSLKSGGGNVAAYSSLV